LIFAIGSIILVRLDISGPPHKNPPDSPAPLDYLEPFIGNEIECPHLHIYVENFDDKWAIPIPKNKFSEPEKLEKTLNDFFNYCNVVESPIIQGRIF
jgi:hypothetical protein